jgi:hypothetical protein
MVTSNRLGKLIGFLMLLFTASQAGKMLHNPLRVRVNSDLIKNVFHKKDQDLLNLVKNIEIADHTLSEDFAIKGLQVSFEPAGGEHEEFNYHLSLDKSKFLGL